MMTDSIRMENTLLSLKEKNKDRRVSERLAADKEIKLTSGYVCYAGTALNFSLQGIFICINISPSVNVKFEVIILIRKLP